MGETNVNGVCVFVCVFSIALLKKACYSDRYPPGWFAEKSTLFPGLAGSKKAVHHASALKKHVLMAACRITPK